MTDIVEQLRNQLEYWNSGGRFDAADEIERLRLALDECERQYQQKVDEVGRLSTEIAALARKPVGRPWERTRVCVAAEIASNKFQQWVPQRWLELFMDAYEAAEPPSPNGPCQNTASLLEEAQAFVCGPYPEGEVTFLVCRLADALKIALSTAVAHKPVGEEEIARLIFDRAIGLRHWDSEWYAEERGGCWATASAILALFQPSPNHITDADALFCNGGYTRSRDITCVCGALGDQKCRAKFSDDADNITVPSPPQVTEEMMTEAWNAYVDASIDSALSHVEAMGAALKVVFAILARDNITHPPPTGCGECGTPPEQVWMQRHSNGCPNGRARPLPIDDEPDHITIRALSQESGGSTLPTSGRDGGKPST